MPSKKKKYNARFPPARIKKIMQTDEEVGKVAAAVPVIISRALELFVKALLQKSSEVTIARKAKTLTTSHIKHGILMEAKFDFLKDLVVNIPDVQEEDSAAAEQGQTAATPAYHRSASYRSRSGSLQAGSSSRMSTVTEDSDNEESDADDEDDDDEEEDEDENRSVAAAQQQQPQNSMQSRSESFSASRFQMNPTSNQNMDDDYDS